MSDLATTARRAAEAPREVASQGAGRFVGAVLLRFRAADGATHVRALAYQMSFVAISGFIGMVGLASALRVDALRRMATELGLSLAPGPSGEVLRQAIRQGSSHAWTAAIVGLSAATVAGTLALAQLERSANRIAGSNTDRPGIRRYLAAAVLALTVGVLFVLGTLVAVGGNAISAALGWSGAPEDVWLVARWPFGAALTLVATYLLFRHVPRERLRERRTIMWGAVVSLALWVVFSAGLALYFSLRSDSGENPYGPLLGVIALLLWSMLTSLAFHLGLATACELAGKRRPAEGEVVELPGSDDEHGRRVTVPGPPSPATSSG